jgi:hypothetical protein
VERRKASAPRQGALPRSVHRRTATFADVARLQMNLRRPALRSLGLLRGGESRIKQNLGRRSVAGTKAIAGTKMPEQNRLKFVQRAVVLSGGSGHPNFVTLQPHVTDQTLLNIRRGITSKTGFDGVAAKSWHAAAIWRGCDL